MPRRGFTVAELAVANAIGAVLIAVLIPWLQKTRADSRSMACRNNLKQIGLAHFNYNDTYNMFAPGVVVGYPSSIDAGATDPPHGADYASTGWGWGSRTLPFLDQLGAYRQIAFSLSIGDQSAEGQGPNGVGIARPEEVAATLESIGHTFPEQRCPEDRSRPKTQPLNRRGDPYHAAAAATTSYYGNAGSFPQPLTEPAAVGDSRDSSRPGWRNRESHNGIFGVNSSVGFRDIKDGTSNTILVGEVAWASDRASVWCGGIRPDGTLGSVNTNAIASSRSQPLGRSIADIPGDTAVRSFLRTGFYRLNGRSRPARELGWSSVHRGGALFVMTDGRVVFISNDIEHIGPPDGGQTDDAGCRFENPPGFGRGAPPTRPIGARPDSYGDQLCGEAVYAEDPQALKAHMNANYGLFQRLHSRSDKLIAGEF